MTNLKKVPSQNQRKPTASLRLSPYAWAKLLLLRDIGDTELGGFGISAAEDFLAIEDIRLVEQVCTAVTVKFSDQSVADYFDQCVDQGLHPEQCGRIWIHTHPGNSARPSSTDEETFARCFGGSDWSVMLIVAAGGQTYARLHFRAGPGGDLELPVEIDYDLPFGEATHQAWRDEYDANVLVDRPVAESRPSREYRDYLEEFLGPFGPALFPDELGPFPFLEEPDDFQRPLSAADRIGAAICA
jgi:proteasome lid subunit RPN8/RPN11